MPRLVEISTKGLQLIDVPSLPWLVQALGGGLVRGAVYLLTGVLGKTTLVNQVLGDLALQGLRVLYISTEQTTGEFKKGLERIHANGATLPIGMLHNLFADDRVDDIDALPKFLTRRVIPAGEEYSGVEVIVIDSVQGRGVSSNATRRYNALYEFLDEEYSILNLTRTHVTGPAVCVAFCTVACTSLGRVLDKRDVTLSPRHRRAWVAAASELYSTGLDQLRAISSSARHFAI